MNKLIDDFRSILRKNNAMVLSTVSSRGNPQCTLIVYVSDGETLYAMTGERTQKVKNIKKNPHVSVTIPFYKSLLHKLVSKAPPASIMFKADAEIIPYTAEEPRNLFRQKMGIEPPDAPNEGHTWIRLIPRNRITCYGVGVPLWDMRTPEKALKVIKLQ